jgi:hypothetical protein
LIHKIVQLSGRSSRFDASSNAEDYKIDKPIVSVNRIFRNWDVLLKAQIDLSDALAGMPGGLGKRGQSGPCDRLVEALDLHGRGFERVIAKETGRPSYHPAVLLKLYFYGYLNRVQSSRRPRM